MKKCDIIIPIYNAYECVKDCVESVIKHTNLKENGLILIDDKSPDERIIPLLKKYKKQHPEIEVLFNKENLGFVGTVNRGMKYSKNDVLLLNSDTEVTKNWLDKMKKCAYSSNSIATVTPLSNNATLASVPNSFEPNNIPEGYSLEEMASLVEKCSLCDYPEIPTGHGFCLYIKREVLIKIGFFDEEAFGKGYGEENDFCFRCLDFGYRNVLCDNVYILHKESQSFTDSKIKLMENGGKVLHERYPEYSERLSLWCSRRPLQYIADNVAYALGANNQDSKKNILVFHHDWNLDNLGGTTLHAYDLIQKLRIKYNFHVLVPQNGMYKLYSYYQKNEHVITYPAITNFGKLNYYNEEYKKMIEKIIDDFAIDIIHVHHMIGHYFDIGNVIEEKNIYSIISLHDLYSVCPLITKMYNNEEYCGKNPTISKCNDCLNCTLKLHNDSIKRWREEWEKYLSIFNKIVVPSNNTKEEINQKYNNLKIDVIEHGVDLIKEKSDISLETESKYYDVAIVGAIGIHKGSKILEQLITKTKLQKIRFHLFGIFDSVYQKNTKHFINHGRYKREELKEKLKENNIKLVCLFSVCPETFSYTLSESVACGIPILAFSIGALEERIKKNRIGWLIPSNSTPEEIVLQINKIFNNPKEYQKVVSNINKYQLKTLEEMSKDYSKIYNKAPSKNKEINTDNIQSLLKENNNYICNVSYSNYAWILDTLKWKLISKVKIPKPIKKVIKKVRNRK